MPDHSTAIEFAAIGRDDATLRVAVGLAAIDTWSTLLPAVRTKLADRALIVLHGGGVLPLSEEAVRLLTPFTSLVREA